MTTGTEALRRVPLFSDLEDSLLGLLAAELVESSHAAGEGILREGDTSRTLHLIRDGKVKVVREGERDAEGEVILAVLGEGDYFGELSLCDGSPRSASVVALQPTTTLVLEMDTFLRFIHAHPGAAVHVMGVLAGRLRRTSERLSEMVFLPLPARLARRLSELSRPEKGDADAGQPARISLTAVEIAPLVGATVPQVEAELRAFREGGIISWDGAAIRILAPELLQERTRGGPQYVRLGHVNVPRWLLEP